MARTTEFVLGLIGGIFGIFGALMGIAIGGIGGAFGASGAAQISTTSWIAVLFAIIGIVGASLVKGKAKLGGWLMIASAVGGVICIYLFYLLPGVLLIIGGLMGVIKKE